MAVAIPLFPLDVVLFPHMPLRLHIFEERYRQMMRDCEERGTGFGVVSIRGATEVGPTAQPRDVGTLAQLRRVEQLADGRYNLLVVGASRYRIVRLSTARPYLVGEVDYLEDSAGDTDEAQRLARRVATAFRAHVTALQERADDPAGELELPDDPELLSYLVSATIEVEKAHKQRLLEIDSAEERLRVCLALLRREAVLLDHRLVRRDTPIATVSLN